MSNTALFYNGDWHRQKPLRYAECFDMPVDELLTVFHSGNYRKNTGTFLMTDSLAKNLDAEHVSPNDFERLRNCGVTTIVTNALHCFSPRFVFNKDYWQKILDLNTRLVPLTLGFRYHEKGGFYLTKDMLCILQQIAERNEIAVRGEYVADILSSYGINNVRIVGCPSLFYHMDRYFQVSSAPLKLESINFNFNQCYSDYFETHLEFCRISLPVFRYIFELYCQKKYRLIIPFKLRF